MCHTSLSHQIAHNCAIFKARLLLVSFAEGRSHLPPLKGQMDYVQECNPVHHYNLLPIQREVDPVCKVKHTHKQAHVSVIDKAT